MRVVVTGGSGQLARGISRFWSGHEILLLDESLLDLSDVESVREAIARTRPDVVINTGSFTQVDRCETELEHAMLVNGTSVGWLADACSRIGANLVQISTDYVFDGGNSRPYTEEDPVNPLSIYGKSKALGEQEARKAQRHLIVRTSWLYDSWGANFYNTMLRLSSGSGPLKVVNDQRGAPTSCRALARQLQLLVENHIQGTIHATCAGETSWHDFASAIFHLHRLVVDLRACSTSDYPRPAPRPAYSVLSGRKRQSLGMDCLPEWHEALKEVAAEMQKSINGGSHE